MSGASRRKGQRGEREAAQQLAKLYAGAARSQSQSRGAECPDVDHTPFWVEVKRRKARFAVEAFLDQAKSDALEAGDARPPLVVMRSDRSEWLALLPLSVLLEALQHP